MLIERKIKWRDFVGYCHDVLIDFLKTAFIYILFYLSTQLFSLAISSGYENYSNIIKIVHFWAFITMLILITAISVTKFVTAFSIEIIKSVALVRHEQHGWMNYLSINEDIETQTKLLAECTSFRIIGLRFNTALHRSEFCKSLSKVQEVRLLFLSKFKNPKNKFEISHNKKYDNSIKLLKEVVIPNASGRIMVKESDKIPNENILIFDDTLARIKKYDTITWSAKKSPITFYHRLIHRNTIIELISNFDERFSKAKDILPGS